MAGAEPGDDPVTENFRRLAGSFEYQAAATVLFLDKPGHTVVKTLDSVISNSLEQSIAVTICGTMKAVAPVDYDHAILLGQGQGCFNG